MLEVDCKKSIINQTVDKREEISQQQRTKEFLFGHSPSQKTKKTLSLLTMCRLPWLSFAAQGVVLCSFFFPKVMPPNTILPISYLSTPLQQFFSPFSFSVFLLFSRRRSAVHERGDQYCGKDSFVLPNNAWVCYYRLLPPQRSNLSSVSPSLFLTAVTVAKKHNPRIS